MALTRNTELRLAPDVQISLMGGELLVAGRHHQLRYGRTALKILATFAEPTRFGVALEALSSGTARHEWAELTAMIVDLVDAGVLLAGEQRMSALAHNWRSFAGASVHVALLNDCARTSAFVDAIRANVRPGDIVVDVGTGTGVLALAAAQAGAAHVYAIERSSIADTAAAAFERAQVSDRVTLLRGHSTQIELPERADVLISEIIGDEPLGERVLEVTKDAVDRLLKPGGRSLPKHIRVFAKLVSIPDEVLRRHVFDPEQVEAWNARYQLQLAGVLDTQSDLGVRIFVEPAQAAKWQALAAPVALASIDLLRPPLEVDREIAVEVARDGRLDGAVIFFELAVDDDHVITTEPGRTAPDCSWLCPVWILPTHAGNAPAVSLRYRHSLSRTILTIEPTV